MVHDQFEILRERNFEFFVGRNARKQNDRLVDAGFAQQLCLRQSRNGEGVCRAKMLRDGDHAMAVSIGFDHRHDARAGRRIPKNLEIVFKRAEPDQGPSSEIHGYASSA